MLGTVLIHCIRGVKYVKTILEVRDVADSAGQF